MNDARYRWLKSKLREFEDAIRNEIDLWNRTYALREAYQHMLRDVGARLNTDRELLVRTAAGLFDPEDTDYARAAADAVARARAIIAEVDKEPPAVKNKFARAWIAVRAALVLAASIVTFRTRELFRPRKPLTLDLPPFERLEPAPIRVREFPQIPPADEEEVAAARALELNTRRAYLEPTRGDAARERMGLPIPTIIPPTMLEVATEAKRQIDEANAERDAALGEIVRAHLVLTEAGVRPADPKHVKLEERIRALQADRATWEARYGIVKRERETFATLENAIRELLWARARKFNRHTSQMPASTIEAVRDLIRRYDNRLARAKSGPKRKRRK